MKQPPRPLLFQLPFALIVAGALTGCGGGGQSDDGGAPSTVSTTSAAGNVAATPSLPSTNAASAPDITSPSPTPSALSNADTLNATTSSAIEAPVPDAAPSVELPTASAEALLATQPALTISTGLSISRETLLAFNTDFTLPHEASPAGVPSGYDWYVKARSGTWNTPPSGFTAITGWGQAFWAKGTPTPSANLLLKNLLTFVCHGSQRQWSLLQSSSVQGAVFQPDYSTNVAVKAMASTAQESGSLALTFPATTAYHFWPTTARGALPGGPLCGTLTVVQARVQPLTANSYATPNLLLGMGADYWLNKTAPWDNYRTNRDVAIGRLKLVKTTWAWYGLSTASNADLERLLNSGFAVTR